MSKKRGPGRPRRPLPGGHRGRTPGPREDTKLRQAVREMSTPVVKQPRRKAGPDDGTYETNAKGQRVFRLKKGHKIGRRPGAKNKVPAGIRASVKAILEDVVKKEHATVRDAIVGGLRGGARHADRYLKLAAEYTDGKPTETMNLNARWNQDELGMAREQLGKKLSGLLSAVLNADAGKQ